MHHTMKNLDQRHKQTPPKWTILLSGVSRRVMRRKRRYIRIIMTMRWRRRQRKMMRLMILMHKTPTSHLLSTSSSSSCHILVVFVIFLFFTSSSSSSSSLVLAVFFCPFFSQGRKRQQAPAKVHNSQIVFLSSAFHILFIFRCLFLVYFSLPLIVLVLNYWQTVVLSFCFCLWCSAVWMFFPSLSGSWLTFACCGCRVLG